MAPFAEASVVEQLEFFRDDERHDPVCKAFFEHHEASYPAVSVLEGVDGFELLMEVYDVFEGFAGPGIVGGEKGFHPRVDLVRRAGDVSTHFVGQFLVVADVEPGLAAVGSPGLQDPVQLLDEGLGESLLSPVDDEVDAAEVIGRLDDVIDVDALVADADRVGLENISGLLMRQTAPFDMVGVVGEVDLGPVVDAAPDPGFLLFAETLQQRTGLRLAFLRQRGVRRDAPGLSDQHGTFHLAGRTPVPDGAVGEGVLRGKLAD